MGGPVGCPAQGVGGTGLGTLGLIQPSPDDLTQATWICISNFGVAATQHRVSQLTPSWTAAISYHVLDTTQASCPACSMIGLPSNNRIIQKPLVMHVFFYIE